MESLLIEGENGGTIEFLNRVPAEKDHSVEEFWVRITDPSLSALRGISAASGSSHPAALFRQMAERWRGWTGELHWESLDDGLCLRASQDRTGHVSILIRLRQEIGLSSCDWSVETTIVVEAGQLGAIARRAELFFGRP